MKKKLIFFVVAILFAFNNLSYAGGSCDIEKIIGAKVDIGIYKVNITREDSNLYKITNQEIYIKTKFCYEYTYGSDAILEITHSSGSFVIGEIHFLN